MHGDLGLPQGDAERQLLTTALKDVPQLTGGLRRVEAARVQDFAGIISGFSLCIFYLVVTRYYPQLGVDYFGMTSMKNPITAPANQRRCTSAP